MPSGESGARRTVRPEVRSRPNRLPLSGSARRRSDAGSACIGTMPGALVGNENQHEQDEARGEPSQAARAIHHQLTATSEDDLLQRSRSRSNREAVEPMRDPAQGLRVESGARRTDSEGKTTASNIRRPWSQ